MEIECIMLSNARKKNTEEKRQIHSIMYTILIDFINQTLQNVTRRNEKAYKSIIYRILHINEDGKIYKTLLTKLPWQNFWLDVGNFARWHFFFVWFDSVLLYTFFNLVEFLQLKHFRRRECALRFVVTHTNGMKRVE